MSALILRLKLVCVFVTACVSTVFPFYSIPAFCEEKPENPLQADISIDDELKYLQEETYVITGTRIPQQIEKTSNSVFVVIDKEIQQMGARFLTDVIPIVPGWHVNTRCDGENYIMVNKASSVHSGVVLIMINSHPLYDAWTGGTIMQYNLISIDNAKRIEFLTGPGSAAYGSGAFIGVVNIITKEADDVDGIEAKAVGGSYDTRQANLLFGKSINALDITANLNFYETDGFDGEIKADRVTKLDELYGTSASLAPGNMKGDIENWDGQLTLKFNGLTFDGKYTDYYKEYPVAPWTNTLDEESYRDVENYYLNLGLEISPWEGADILTKAYYNHNDFLVYGQILPEGALIMTPIGPAILDQDLLMRLKYKAERTGIESQMTYEITDLHTMVAGVVYEEMRIYDANLERNYAPTSTPWVIIPLPGIQDMPDEYNYHSYHRNFKAIFLEDVWDINTDLRLDVGIRYDHYSDFGGAFSPRAGLNWQFAESYYARLNYAHAFRAPTMQELHEPTWGSTDLKEVNADLYELALGARFHPSFKGEAKLFYSEAKDPISLIRSTNKYANFGEAKRKGITLIAKYDIGRGSYLAANYTYVDLELIDMDMEDTFADHFAMVMANARLNRYLNWNVHCLYRGGWAREEDDPRDNMSDYAVVNTTLIARKFLKGLEGLELAFTVNNLFDESYSSPSLMAMQELPGDFPMPRRNFLFEVRYTY